MMLAMSCSVKFRVRVKTRPGESVCVVGESQELGGWDPLRAVVLQKETSPQQTDTIPSAGTSNLHPDEHSEIDGDVWSKTVDVKGGVTQYYRYFICKFYQSDEEGVSGRGVSVKWWEGHIKPRNFSPKEAIQKLKENTTSEPDVFGNYDGIHLINRGWLMEDEIETQLQIEGEPISMWKAKYQHQVYSIKCTPIRHSYKNTMSDEHEDEMLGDSLPQCTNTEILVSVLEKGRSKRRPQCDTGAIFNTGSFLSFHAVSREPESLGYQLDFYVHDTVENGTAGTENNKQVVGRHIGFCFILPLDMKKSQGSKKIPITGLSNKPIGQIKVNYLVVKPMIGAQFNMKQTFQRYWKSTRRPVDVGHRGLGSSYKCKKLAIVKENTVRSFQYAANHGADFVEFDVHLTKDEVPIIYHDFRVLLTYRKKKREDLELFELPIKDLTFSELQEMKVSHPSYQPEHKYEDIQDDDVDPDDLQAFPSMKQVFQEVDKHTGFNIEVKYPQKKKDGSGMISDYFDMNRFLDIILADVFKYHNGRRIVFSSFEPDICSMLRLKQNVYPVLFLSQAMTPRYIPYATLRAQGVVIATEFAVSAGLLGVDVISDLLFPDHMDLIKYVKDAGLVLFVWGEGCNDKDTIQKLKENKVDGIIYDRIDFYKTGEKESIFKIEEKRKLDLVQRPGASTSGPSGVTKSPGHDSGNDSP